VDAGYFCDIFNRVLGQVCHQWRLRFLIGNVLATSNQKQDNYENRSFHVSTYLGGAGINSEVAGLYP
jgi:hypothetical protein